MKFKNKKPWLNDELLTRQGEMLIARSSSSQSNNEWLAMEGKEFYFKPENKNVGLTGPLGELLYFYIAKQLGMQALEVKPAYSYFYEPQMNRSNEIAGVISQNIITDKEKQALVEFWSLPLIVQNDVQNNMESVRRYIKTFEGKQVKVKCDLKKIEKQMTEVCMLDYFLVTQDRHKGNLALITTKKDDYVEIAFAPIFDNSMILYLTTKIDSMTDYYNKKQYSKITEIINEEFTPCFFITEDNSRHWMANLKTDIATAIMKNKYFEEFFENIKKINLNKIAKQIESDFPGYQIPPAKIKVGQFILNKQIKNIEQTIAYLNRPKEKTKRLTF